jgi:hypothetical protein
MLKKAERGLSGAQGQDSDPLEARGRAATGGRVGGWVAAGAPAVAAVGRGRRWAEAGFAGSSLGLGLWSRCLPCPSAAGWPSRRGRTPSRAPRTRSPTRPGLRAARSPERTPGRTRGPEAPWGKNRAAGPHLGDKDPRPLSLRHRLPPATLPQRPLPGTAVTQGARAPPPPSFSGRGCHSRWIQTTCTESPTSSRRTVPSRRL